MIYATTLNGNKTFECYEVNAKRTMNKFSSDEVMRLNAKMGLAGETGELIDCVKKLLTHNCNAEREETIKRLMIDEIGDIVWYIASSLSSYYQISFNEIGANLLHNGNSKVKLVDQNMLKYCSLKKDPSCPYNKISKSYDISKIDDLIKEENKQIELSEFWEELDFVSFKLRRSETREEIVKLSSDLIIILGNICHQFLNITLEDALTANIVRLQNRYPLGFDRIQASERIDVEEFYKTDQMHTPLYVKR
jgi:NTP pyrophosphatase (non-canonical NTP hydrolase)